MKHRFLSVIFQFQANKLELFRYYSYSKIANGVKMDLTQRKHFRLLILIAIVFFVLFAFPNATGSKNVPMVEVFAPDEATPLPFLFHMIAPTDSLVQNLKNFIFYNYYPYGFLYFAFSAIVVLPLQWLGLLGNIQLVMLILRQLISILPLLAALLILVYMQDGFRTYRSFVLFAFLVSIPAVIENNLWWHPDGLATLFVVLTLFFLHRDKLRFSKNFYLAAILCGLAVATKLIGLYFFLAVGLTLILGLVQKKIVFRKAIKAGAFFILLMVTAYFISSPFWLSHWARAEFFTTMQKQSEAISSGYGVIYEKGLLASWPLVHQYYGELIFLAVCLGSLLYGIIRGTKRLLFSLILAWFIPLSVTVFYFSHFKFQYWMPAILPVISCVAILIPEKLTMGIKRSLVQWMSLVGLIIVAVQFGLFLKSDISHYTSTLHREINNPSISFYDNVTSTLKPVQDLPLFVYFDPSIYLPQTQAWTSTTTFDLLSYGYIGENKFDVLLLMKQRILDYLNPNVTGIDPTQFALNQQFYRDAQNATVSDYDLVFENDFGKIFVSDKLYKRYFVPHP